MSYLISPDSDLNEVLNVLNEYKFCIVVDNENTCIGTITDGDLRRSIIKGNSKDLKASDICEKQYKYAFNSSEAEKLYKDIRFVPIVNREKKYLSTQINNINKSSITEVPLVIMAGGKGKRMRDYTKNLPKPLLKIKGKSMLEIIIEKVKGFGIKNIYISINYLGQKIKDSFKDGSNLQVNIIYIEEEKELDTAGSLKDCKLKNHENVIVINGDVICDLDFNSFYRFHQYRNNHVTLAVKKHIIKNQFGVVNYNGLEYIDIEEKPEYMSYINAGIYVINKKVINLINHNEKIDIPTLFERAKNNNLKCEIYPFDTEWNDVGSINVYQELNK